MRCVLTNEPLEMVERPNPSINKVDESAWTSRLRFWPFFFNCYYFYAK